MSRARNIKPGFFTNGDLIECSPLARLLFIGLWTEADRRGVLEDRPKTLKLKLLPGDNCDAEELLQELADHGFILRYEADGVRCIYIAKFCAHQTPHQKEPENTMPLPDGYETCTRHVPDLTETSTEQAETSTASRAPALTSYTTESTTESISRPSRSSEPDPAFETFWSLYPRKEDRKGASRSWSRVRKSDHATIMVDIQRRLDSGQWVKGSPYIPIPTTYLNRERWTDEIPAAITTAVPDKVAEAIAEKERLLRGDFRGQTENLEYRPKTDGPENLARRIAELDRIITGQVAA
jgi:hypothetical protein